MLSVLLCLTAAAAEWSVQPQSIQWAGGEVVRERVSFGGLPYDGPVPTIRRDPAGIVLGRRNPRPDKGPATLVPIRSSEEASRRVALGWQADPINRGTLVVFPVGQEARLAWRFAVSALGGQWRVWVDATDGEVLAAEADSWSIDGWVYDPDPVTGDLVSVEFDVEPSARHLDGPYVWASQCTDWTIDIRPFGLRRCNDWRQSAKANAQGNFFEQPDEGSLDDPFAEVNAYFHADRFARWLAVRFGIRVDTMQIFTGFPLTNAFYGDFDDNGTRDLSFGVTDDGYNLAYDSDVVIHEFGHAVVRQLAGSLSMGADSLGVDWTPGALNEGVADAFAMLLNRDPLLAESMARSERWDVAIRDLEPDRVCPDDLASQVHRSGQIWGSLAWNLIDDPRVGPDVTSELLVAAVSTWDKTIDWQGAGHSLISASEILLDHGWLDELGHKAVVAHIQATGMLDCERIIDMQRVDAVPITMLNLGLSGQYERIPAGVQFKYAVPPESDELRIRVSDFTGAKERTGLAIYVRTGAPVEHETMRIDGLGLQHAVPVTFDAVFEVDEEAADVVIDNRTVSTFQPGVEVYWSVASINRSRDAMDAVYLSVTMGADALIGQEVQAPKNEGSGCSYASARRLTVVPGSSALLLFCVVGVRRKTKHMI
jgi:hypothetical protein